MSDKHAYTYVCLRYRHDPLAGEFLNVGVIVHSASARFLGAKFRRTSGRLSKVFPDLNSQALRDTLRAVEHAVKRLAKSEGSDLLGSLVDAGKLARCVVPEDDSSLIWGTVGSGIASDMTAVLEGLYRRFVARYDESHVHHRDDAAIWKPVRERLAKENLAGRLQPKTIVSPADRVDFEHAWKNGIWHCYQPISFDLANEDTIRDKARRWAGQMLALRDATEQFKSFFLVGSPGDPKLTPAYRAAIEILRRSPVEHQIFEENSLDDLVNQIEDEIRAHDITGE